MAEPDAPVGIVGAGPVGLTLALRLASFGVPSVVLECDESLRRQGSKACLIQGDVLEVLDKVGCAEDVAAEGVAWHVAHTYVRGREIRRTVYPRPLGFGPFVNISQYRIEQVLLARLESEPLARVLWSHRVTALDQDAEGVTVTATTPRASRRMRFRYLAACDGVRSTLRDIVGVHWTGYTHSDRFLITDIRAELPVSQHRHFHYDPPFNPGRQLVMHPQPHNVWRIDWQLPPDADIDAERRTGQLDRRIRDVIGEVDYEIDWLSTYRFHQRVVDQFAVGRVFFAGDAAHALPPYGARGMNSGIQDVDNLAWKLALVLDGLAPESLLDSYHLERYAAAEENLRITEATIRFMVPPSAWRRLGRSLMLRLSGPVKSMRRHVNSGRMAEPYVYRDSPLVGSTAGCPLVGAFAPDGMVLVAGRPRRLRTLFGARFTGLLLAADAAEAGRFAEEARRCAGPIASDLVLVLPAGTGTGGLPELPEWPELPGRAGPVTVARAESGEQLASAYRAEQPGWYLVRPDGHVGAFRPLADGPRFVEVVNRCAGADTGVASGGQPSTPQTVPGKESS